MGTKTARRIAAGHEFEAVSTSIKIAGEAVMPDLREMQHGDEVFIVARAKVSEVSFPEKNGAITRVHKAKLTELFLIAPEVADVLMAEERERQSGQGNIIAEIERGKRKAPKLKSTDEVVAETAIVVDGDNDDDDDWMDDDDDFGDD